MRVQPWILAVAVLALLLLTIAMQTLSVTVHTRSGHTMVDSTSGLIGVLAAFLLPSGCAPRMSRAIS